MQISLIQVCICPAPCSEAITTRLQYQYIGNVDINISVHMCRSVFTAHGPHCSVQIANTSIYKQVIQELRR